ncbi:MAG: transcription factor S [ANME-2 cluster archaeon]|nr:transcription factor S [ANME-2 cluster archaeon]MDF1557923.1 transcription factor S [ANME-2 cluster archaeon]
MEFCPKCKSMMMPSAGKMKCKKCGCEKERTKSAGVVEKKEFQEREVTVLEGNEAAGLPTSKVVCEECGNNLAYWWLRQLRSADESETRFFRCTKCGRTWREYD